MPRSKFHKYIQPKFKTYQERRNYIKESMEPLLNTILNVTQNPTQINTLKNLSTIDSDSVRNFWFKAMNRSASDFDGAITAAKSFIEDMFKYILNSLQIDYSDDNDDLPKLFSLVTTALSLSPAQHGSIHRAFYNGLWGILARVAHELVFAHVLV